MRFCWTPTGSAGSERYFGFPVKQHLSYQVGLCSVCGGSAGTSSTKVGSGFPSASFLMHPESVSENRSAGPGPGRPGFYLDLLEPADPFWVRSAMTSSVRH